MELIPHPEARCDAVRRLSASCRRLADPRVLLLSYRLEGDLGQLRIPSPRPPVRTDELWRHTCLEAFVQPAGQSGYGEFNFSPATQWAVYAFDGYRAGMRPLELSASPQIAVETAASALVLTARVQLPPLLAGSALRVGLTAVIEDGRGPSWWALRHAAGKPDFHLAAGFTLEC